MLPPAFADSYGRTLVTPAHTTRVLAARRPAPLLEWAQCAMIALALTLVAGILHLGVSPYVSFALMGAIVLHVFAWPSGKDVAWAAACAAMFGVIYFLCGGPVDNYPANWIALPGALLGMGSIQVLSARWIFSVGEERRARLDLVCDASLVAGLCIVTVIAVSTAIYFTPLTYDRLLMAADLKFGEPPGWMIGRWFRNYHPLYLVCAYAYNSLPLGLSIFLAIEWRMRRRNAAPPVDLRWQAVALGISGFLLYQVCPAAGPIYLVDKVFPFQQVNLSGMEMVAAPMQMVARNAMPSLHVGWTLLLFWSTRRRHVLARIASGIYLTLTVLATLGLGVHYLVDLMMSPPVALLTFAMCSPRKQAGHWIALGAVGALTFAWLIAFRTGWALMLPSGSAWWAIAILTAATPIALYMWLVRSYETRVS